MLLAQIHQLAIIFPFFVCMVLFKKALMSWKLLLFGIVLGLIPIIPYFWYVLPMLCMFNCNNASLVARFSFYSIDSLIRPFQILSIGNFHTEFGNDFALFAKMFPIIYKLDRLTYLSFIGIPFGAYILWLKAPQYRSFVFVSILYILFLFTSGIEPLMHYYILLVPCFALFIGMFFSFFIQKRWSVFFGIALICGYFISLALFSAGFLLFLGQKGGLNGDYGVGYKNSIQPAREILKKYQSHTNYQEIELMYLSPIEYFHGYMPIGKMLFPFDQLKKTEQKREKEFFHDPDSPVLLREEFAYYTQDQNPSWNFIVFLYKKTKNQNKFSFISRYILNTYLYVHLKRFYENPNFVLLYPEHWIHRLTNTGDFFSDGNVTVTIDRIESGSPVSIQNSFLKVNQKLSGISVEKDVCFTTSHIWCGATYQPITFGSSFYSFSAVPLNSKGASYGERVFDDVMSSLRKVN